MPTAKARLINGSNIREVAEGLIVTERYLCYDLDPAQNAQVQALQCPGVPVYNQNHGNVANCRVRERFVEPFLNSKTQCYVTVTFLPPTLGGIQGERVELLDPAGTRLFRTDPDTGLPLLVGYNPNGTTDFGPFPVKPPSDSQFTLGSVYNPITLEAPRRGRVYVYSRTASIDFMKLQTAYHMAQNSDTWNGHPPGTVICRSFTGPSINGIATFAARVVMEYDAYLGAGAKGANRGNWNDQYTAFYREPATGEVPGDVAANIQKGLRNGWVQFDLIKQQPFKNLGFTEIFS